jgi:hypothetical protein
MHRYIEIINKFIEHENKYNNTTYELYATEKINYTDPIDIINVKYLNELKGGTKFIYPIHHFMMGKGKSTVITPLVALHLSLIYDKNVYVIVPSHLLVQTNNIMGSYIKLFELDKKINIVSDIKIKMDFLEGKFTNGQEQTQNVFLIDEFDTVLDPIKSNFNLTIKKDTPTNNIYNLIKYIVQIIKTKKSNRITLADLNSQNFKFDTPNLEIIINDINKIIIDLDTGVLIKNINWGISEDKCWAIPYLNKDNPMINSSFSSCILTIFLTLYHYIIDLDYKIDKFLYNYIIQNDLTSKFLHINKQNQFYSIEVIDNYFNAWKNGRHNIINLILDEIFSKLLLSTEQYNVSFVDIINTDKIFKVAYSGIINTLLPLLSSDNFDSGHIIRDWDESTNIKHAMDTSTIITNIKLANYKKQSDDQVLDNFFDHSILNYQAIIDTAGLFKNIDNKIVAIKIYETIQQYTTRISNVIYLDEFDHPYVYNNGLTPYDSSIIYSNPFLYYSQTHIIGIDIKQDNYPILKGLCIINSNSTYSIVAQSMFRLRKLNQGHSIDFLFIDPLNSLTPTTLNSYLIKNETNSQLSKEEYLVYQTIKSEIRKYRYLNQAGQFKDHFKEKVKHYYLELIQYSDKPKGNINDIFDGIFTESEIMSAGVYELFAKINNIDSIYKLVYKINSLITEQEQEQEKMKEIENVLSPRTIFEDFIIGYGFDDKFINWDGDITNYSISIDNQISYLPNIYCKYNLNNYYPNTTSIVCVYINDKVLIIPGYMLGYFIDKYPVFNFKLELFNTNKFSDVSFMEKIKDHIIFDIYNIQSKDYNISTIELELLLLLFFSCVHMINYTPMITKIINFFYAKYTNIDKYAESADHLIRVVNNQFNQIINKIRTKITQQMISVSIKSLPTIKLTNELINQDIIYKKKYLKYKQKYWTLKLSPSVIFC